MLQEASGKKAVGKKKLGKKAFGKNQVAPAGRL
jgi:hypothetical protein